MLYIFDEDQFQTLKRLQEQLHNKEQVMTFNEQRDFAESLRLILNDAWKQDA